MATLLVFRGDSLEREIELGVRPIRIGRNAANDVVLTDPGKSVSRAHAELRFEGGAYVLTDLGSQNGLVVDGNRLERVVMDANVPVMIGPFRLVLEPTSGRAERTADDGTMLGATPRGDEGDYADYDDNAVPPERDSGISNRGAARGTSVPPRRGEWLRGKALPLVVVGAVALVATGYGLSRIGGSGTTSEVPPPVDAVAQHLAEAKTLLDGNEPERAIAEHLDPALALDPGNVEAVDLKRIAETMIATRNVVLPSDLPPSGSRSQPPTSVIVPPRTREPIDPGPEAGTMERPINIPPESGGLPRLPAESNAQLRQRERQTREAFDEGKAQAARGEFTRAEQTFLGIISTAGPRYLDVSDQLASLRRRRGEAAAESVRAAVQAENNQRFDEAIAAYQRARQLDPSVSIDAELARLRDKKLKIALSKLEEADAYYNYRADAMALRAYEEALRLLPENHPRYAEVKKRIEELRK